VYDVPNHTLKKTYHMRQLSNGKSDPSKPWMAAGHKTPQQTVCPASCTPCAPSATPGTVVSNAPRITPVQFFGNIQGGGQVVLSIHGQQVVVPTTADMTPGQLVQQLLQQFNRYWQQTQRQQQAKSADIDPRDGQILHLRNVDVQELTVEVLAEPDLRFEFTPHPVVPGVAPDLIPVRAPGNPTFCERHEGLVLAYVKNQGNAAAGRSAVRIRFSVGTNLYHEAETATGPISPGDTHVVGFTVPEDCGPSDCHFTITVDALNEVPESDESNNSVNGTCIG